MQEGLGTGFTDNNRSAQLSSDDPAITRRPHHRPHISSFLLAAAAARRMRVVQRTTPARCARVPGDAGFRCAQVVHRIASAPI